MPQAKGSNSIMGYQIEAAFATDPVTPDLTKLYFLNESLKLERPNIYSEIIQSSRQPTTPNRGNHNVTGTINTTLQAYIGGLLKASLGDLSTGSGPPYTHTLKIGASVPSVLIEKGFTDITTPEYFKYNGCKVNRMTIKIRPAGAQEISFDFVGAKETVGEATFDATPTDLTKIEFQGFQIATINEGGSPIAIVAEADIILENNLDADVYTINIATPGVRRSLPEGMIKVSGTLKALFEDITLYNKAKNGTESALVVTYTIGTGAGTAGNEQLTITVPELLYSPSAPPVEGPKGVLVSLPFEAYYANDAAASALHMVLKSPTATF